MKVAIIGTGYVGLVSGTCLAEIGHHVVCVDIDEKKISQINNCESPIHENGLEELLIRNVSRGRLRATAVLSEAMAGAEVTIIAVGTPFDGKDIDLTFVRRVASEIGEALRYAPDYHVVCVKSTVVPGTTESVVGPIVEKISNRTIGVNIGLAMNPEFLAEGTAIQDFMEPDRIVIGSNDIRTVEVLRRLYAPFEGTDLIITTPSTAEMIKYASNSFLASVISFSNEIANLCSAVDGVDVIDVLKGLHADRRLSPILPHGRVKPGLLSFLHPGTGFGGSCFSKDVKTLISFGARIGRSTRMLDAVMATNNVQPEVTLSLLRDELGSLDAKRVAVLGLAFKPGTDDVRESPAIPIICHLLDSGAKVVAHDPIAIDSMKKMILRDGIVYTDELEFAVSFADAIVLVTSWPQYELLHELSEAKNVPVIDGRRFLDKSKYKRYRGIGLSG